MSTKATEQFKKLMENTGAESDGTSKRCENPSR